MLGPSEQNVSVQALLPVKEEPQQAGSRVSLNYISPKPFRQRCRRRQVEGFRAARVRLAVTGGQLTNHIPGNESFCLEVLFCFPLIVGQEFMKRHTIASANTYLDTYPDTYPTIVIPHPRNGVVRF